VTADIRPLDANLFDLQFSISEGEKVTVESVIITGNKVTRRSTILKEVMSRPGDEASFEKIQESKGRLERLGIFSEVRIEEIQVSPGHENLVINVREGERNYAGLGIGVETKKEPRSFALWENGMALRGTAEFIRSNLLGIAAQISLVTQFSLVEKRAVVSWEQPYFFGLPMQTLMSAWLEREDRLSFGFDRRGVSLTAMKPLFRNMLLLATMGYSRTRLTFLEIAESEVDRQLFPYSTTLLSVSLIWDKRDDTFNPGKGFFLSVVSEWAYPLFKTESDYLKTFLKFQHFYPIITNLNFSTTARLGLGRGRMPIPERFFSGGSNSFRGEAFDALGPKDPDSNMPVGGKAMFVLNLELKFPLLQSLPDLAGAVFYDLGNVFSRRSEFNIFDFRGATGLGLRYRTPLGPLRFDLAWDLDSQTRRGRPLMFITIGNVF